MENKYLVLDQRVSKHDNVKNQKAKKYAIANGFWIYQNLNFTVAYESEKLLCIGQGFLES